MVHMVYTKVAHSPGLVYILYPEKKIFQTIGHELQIKKVNK